MLNSVYAQMSVFLWIILNLSGIIYKGDNDVVDTSRE